MNVRTMQILTTNKQIEIMNKTNNHQDSYGVFCMTDRMLARGYKIDGLDIFWGDAQAEYEKFLNSEFNVDSKSELDCIDEYFNNL